MSAATTAGMPSLQPLTRLPRVLAGALPGAALSYEEHLDVHGPLPPVSRYRRRGTSALVDEIERSGLRGHGGAAFPTAAKMRAVMAGGGRGRTVLVNATEGEPASRKDRTLLALSPHLAIDGGLLAAQALGARELLLCVSERSREALAATRQAVRERRFAGRDAHVRVLAIPHSYISGQETALVDRVNGGEGKPTFTPPAVFERGVGGRPSFVSNAETFAHLALIGRHGADWFRSIGTPHQPGSALVTLFGAVARPGVYEIEHGASLVSLVDAAGGAVEQIRAVLLGGYAGGWVDGARLPELRLEDGRLAAYGASLGAGVIGLLGASGCGVAETARVARWMAGASAGQCGPCVHGLDAIAAQLEAWAAGDRDAGAERVARLTRLVAGRGACGHPGGVARFVRTATEVFAAEFADHARHGRCEGCLVAPTLPLPPGSQPL